MLFILFYLILFLIVHINMTFVCVLRVTWMCPLAFFSPFLVNYLHFILALLIHVKNHFSFAIIVYIIIVIITIIIFFSTLPVIGEEFSKLIRPTFFLILFFCQFVVFVLYYFFRDISPNSYVIETAGFSDLSMILVNLWKI